MNTILATKGTDLWAAPAFKVFEQECRSQLRRGHLKTARARRSYDRARCQRIVNYWLMGAMTATRANLCIRGLWSCASAPKPSLIATTVAD